MLPSTNQGCIWPTEGVHGSQEVAYENSDDRIEKVIEMDAPVARVWRAVTDHEEFGQWFASSSMGPSSRARCRRVK